MNASKTKVSYFTAKFLNSTSKPYIKLTLGLSPLEYISEYKYLGLTINTNLNFKKHLTTTLKSVSHKAYKLYKIRNCLSAKTALQLYKSMILPVVDYGDIFTHNKNDKILKKLQTIQNRCILTIFRLQKLANTNEEEKKLDLLPLTERSALHVLQFAFDLSVSDTTLFTKASLSQHNGVATRSMAPDRHQFKIFRPVKKTH